LEILRKAKIKMNRILLVEPDFPIPPKSKNHKNFFPIGLLKIGAYLRSKGCKVKLVRGKPKNLNELNDINSFNPDEIWITSLFTYWAEYVKDVVHYYKELFPDAKTIVGGIFASLLPSKKVKNYTGCDEVVQGVIKEAEKFEPAYDLINNGKKIDFQIIHTTRGCPRKCSFCGTWKIEPEFIAKKTIKDLIKFRKVVFYDNNLLLNPYIENILEELIELKKEGKISWVESQSGFDGRILFKKPYLAEMLKKAGFRYPRIAWDWGIGDFKKIKEQVEILIKGGYKSKDIFLFMIYDWDLSFEEMEQKRIKCWELKVQISDCRYRPLDQLYDHYNPRKEQTLDDYYIHEKSGWTDQLIKQFRRNVREQNICLRHGFLFYSRIFERKAFPKITMQEIRNINDLKNKIKFLKGLKADYWIPDKIRYPKERSNSKCLLNKL
jgi:hypothetical protein